MRRVDESDRLDLFEVDWSRLRAQLDVVRRFQGLGKRAKLGVMMLAMLGLLLGFYPVPTHATGANMLLFWDPANGSVPSGWCLLSGYNGFFPKASSVSDTTTNWGSTFSAPTRPNSMSGSIAVSGASASEASAGGGNGAAENFTTGNIPSGSNPSLVFTADSNGDSSNPDLPAFRNLEIMMYGSGSGGSCTGNGIPNTIPQNGIALFNTTIPSGWTQVTAQNGKMVRMGATSCGANCGGDNETNSVTISGLNGDGTGSTNQSTFLGVVALATAAHTHAPPSTLTCTSGCSTSGSVSCPIQGTAGTTGPSTSKFNCTADQTEADPPFVQPLMGIAGSNTPTISLNITAMFDNDPGTGWAVLSGSGGQYNNQFIRPATTTANLTSIGQVNRPSQVFTGVSGNAITATLRNLTLGGNDVDAAAHTHTYTITTTGGASNYPPYFDIVVAQKVNFTLNAYQWYVEPASPTDDTLDNVNGMWPAGSLNTAQNAGIVAIPAAYKPPITTDQLRLRVQVLVTGKDLTASSLAFKLQYNKGTTTDCLSGSWTDVAASSATTDPWRYGSDGVTDPFNVTTNYLGSTAKGLYQKSAATTSVNPSLVTTGQTVEYDWLLNDYSATGATQYNFRVVEDHDPSAYTILSVYNFCPSVVTRPTTDQDLRHGEFFRPDVTSGNPDQGFEWVD